MNLTFYKNQSEKNKIGKNLTDAKDVTGTLRENCDILNPSILVEYSTYPDYNYIFIPEFKRYYFITNIVSVRFGLWQITAHVDVLESYKEDIKAQSAIIARQENKWDMYLNDGTFKSESYNKTATIKFPNDCFVDYNFILTVAGGQKGSL